MTNEDSGDDKIQVFNFLLDAGCCKRCSLRFLGDSEANYEDIEGTTKAVLNIDEDTQPLKRVKPSPCIICFDLLQDEVLEKLVEVPESHEILEYDADTFINFVSFPVSSLLRGHSVEIYIKDKFPNWLKDRVVVPINKAWSLAIQNKLAKTLNKKYDKNADLHIQFNVTYDLDDEETSVLSCICKEQKSNRKDILSRNFLGEFLKTVDPEKFRQQVSVPPKTPNNPVVFQNVTYKHEAIFIAGRYCKYARTIGQSPWVVDDVKIVENSVQEIIFKALENVFNCKTLVFSSSGREDFDVRTLGRGRPFFIKVCDPKITKIPPARFRTIETEIQETELIKVRDLQFIDRKCLNLIKEGEQFKRKTYRALCFVEKSENLDSSINKINALEKLTLQQKTPIRVYHRRSSDVRERVIYKIKARPITGRGNLFELDMVTQAGTYVKEFVHGDLGRTKPSLSNIIGGHVDIVALDVLNIHLDFPPSLSI